MAKRILASPRKSNSKKPRVRALGKARFGRSAGVRDRESPRIPLIRRDKLAGEWFAKLVALQALLRGPKGCPWDREQTHESLRKFLIEETYEVLDALESGDPRKFASELGDLLLQVTFHSILAEETGAFTISDVIESVYTKMVRRHPHVFGELKAKDSAAVLKKWEEIKVEERAEERAAEGKAGKSTGVAGGPESILGGVPRSLPAVMEAYQLTRRAARIGFDWENISGIFEKLDEEKSEILASLQRRDAGGADSSRHLEEEIGDLLFVAVNVARFLGSDPEIALKKANRKFLTRFQWMEAAANAEGSRLGNLPRERMEELWDLSKEHEPRRAATAK
jgi:tetrapyrrole methylase family protein/MazG family protein